MTSEMAKIPPAEHPLAPSQPPRAPAGDVVKAVFGAVRDPEDPRRAVEEALEAHGVGDPETVKKSNRTVLHEACLLGKEALVRWLVEDKGMDATSQNASGRTTLHYAAATGRVDVLKYLVEERGVPALKNDVGRTPLHACSQRGAIESVRYLVSRGLVPPATEDAQGLTPLHAAAERNHADVVRFYVLEQGMSAELRSQGSPDGILPVHAAARGDALDALRFLVEEAGADELAHDGRGRGPLESAAETGAVGAVRYLLDRRRGGGGAEQAEATARALRLAIQHDHAALVEWFIGERGVDYRAVPDFVFFAILHPGDENITRLREVLPNVTVTDLRATHPHLGLTALQLASALKGRRRKRRHRHKDGGGGDGGGDTAAERREERRRRKALGRIQRLLVSWGATPFGSTLMDRHRVPPSGGLAHAVHTNPSYLPHDLLGKAGSVNDTGGDPALHRTVTHFVAGGTPGMRDNDVFRWMEELRRAGADLAARDDEGWSPLHEAAFAARPEVARAVLGEHPGLADAESYAGETPLELARWRLRRAERRSERLAKPAPPPSSSSSSIARVPAEGDQDDDGGGEEADGPHDEVDPDTARETLLLVAEHSRVAGWRRTFGNAWRRALFALLVLAYGLVYPARLLYLSVGAPLSSVLPESAGSVGRAGNARRALALAALMAAVLAPLALLAAGAAPETVSYAVVLVPLAFLAFMASNAVKARREPRFVRVREPRDSVRLRGDDMRKGQLRENVQAIVSLALEFLQFQAFSFLPPIGDWSSSEGADGEDEATGPAKVVRLALLDVEFSVASLEYNKVVAGFAAAFAIVFAWYVAAGFLGTSILVLRSGRASDRPRLRRLFPFVQPNFYAALPAPDVVVPLLSQTLFLPVVGQLLGAVNCVDDGGAFVLASSRAVPGQEAIECWTGSHAWWGSFAVVLLLVYLPTSSLTGVFFLDGESSGDINVTGAFQVIALACSLLLTAATTVFSSALVNASGLDLDSATAWLSLSFTLCTCVLLSVLCATMAPCQHVRAVNCARATSFGLGAATSAAAMVALALDGAAPAAPYAVLAALWAAVAGVFGTLWRRGYPFTRRVSFRVVDDGGEAGHRRDESAATAFSDGLVHDEAEEEARGDDGSARKVRNVAIEMVFSA